ncbi:Mus7/MMS22 family-domain-containing protein [Scheffersomyces xylosifermentans]|uniref:Mus7/MMS22 family-domain-containing protein n=1 Tax=Scheffersomyces xylosifermentans TaxID=1304137 RepID=UPI00315CEF9C
MSDSQSVDLVPDSESEDNAELDSSMISPLNMASVLTDLSPSKRNIIQSNLQKSTKFSGLFSNDEWNDLSIVVAKRRKERYREEDTVEDSEGEQDKDQYLSGSNVNQNNNIINNTHTQAPSINSISPVHKSDHEDNNNLQIYLDSRNYESAATSRRGLRKRNFASTHPYLADQAHYLGLTSIDYLNEIYQENNHDLEPIVKYLNYTYIKQKESNPRDEKFKAKNFYSILGKQSRLARNKEEEEIEKEAETSVQDTNENYELADSQAFASYSQGVYDSNSEYNSDSDESIDLNIPYHELDQEFKSIYHRNFSSEKRLHIPSTSHHGTAQLSYKHKFKKTPQVKELEHRKGLAVRKYGPKAHKASTSRYEMRHFVSEDFDEPAESSANFYHQVDLENQEEEKTGKIPRLDTFGILSDSSSSSEDDLSQHGNDLFDDSPTNFNTSDLSVEQIGVELDLKSPSAPEDADLFDIQEGDFVNPMFANIGSGKRKRNTQDGPKKKRVPSTSKGTQRASSNKPKAQHKKSGSSHTKKKQRLLSDTSFGKLPKKRLTLAPSRIMKKKKKKRPPKKHDSSAPTKNTRELFSSEYQFSRNPVQSTIAFEAESDKKYVTDRIVSMNPSLPRYYSPDSLVQNEIHFPNHFILGTIDIKRIKQMDEGKRYVLQNDSVYIKVMGENFAFTLFNNNHSHMEGFLSFLIRLVKSRAFLNDAVSNELYEALKGILKWALIVQESPSEKCWRLLNSLLSATANVQDYTTAEKCRFWFPYTYLLYYTLFTISRTTSSEEPNIDIQRNLRDMSQRYWILFFRNFESNDFALMLSEGKNSKSYESFYIMYTLMKDSKDWWQQINCALVVVATEVDIEIILDAIYALAVFCPSSGINWSSFYRIYESFSRDSDSRLHNRFLDIVYSLNRKFGWPIEERMILQFYAAITSRKFANFDDEWVVPELMGRIRTRDDIPDGSFFERFMLFLYSYISELPEESKTKRLITKLFTSSRFNYSKGKEHFAMFINRCNFILLLTQLSKVDLKNQLYDLVFQISNTRDAEILKVSIDALNSYLEICISKGLDVPTDTMSLLVNSLGQCYFSLSGVIKLWKDLMGIFETLVTPFVHIRYTSQFLTIVTKVDPDTPSRMLLEMYKLAYQCLQRIINDRSKFDETRGLSQTIQNLNDANYRVLNTEMGRFPLPTVAEEEGANVNVEIGIKIWIRCTHLSSKPNWDKLALQSFPYIGNHYSRDKFILFFYNEILKFHPLQNCKDMVVLAAVISLCSFSFSKYLALILNSLIKEKNEVFTFQKKVSSDDISVFHLQTIRHRLLSNVLLNISRSSKINNIAKRNYLDEIVKTLTSEYDRYFSSSWYKGFCTSSVMSIQKHFPELISDDKVLSLASKLGISHSELDWLHWQTLPTSQRLSNLHNELANALHYKKDCDAVLTKYTMAEDVDLLYHLLSIYSKAISLNQGDKWKLVSILLSFFSERMKQFKFNIVSPSFKRFLKMLTEFPKLHSKQITPGESYGRTSSLVCIAEILLYSNIVFDGYKDLEFVKSVSAYFIDSHNSNCGPNSSSSLSYSFSALKFYDISPSGQGLEVAPIEPPPAEVREDVEMLLLKKLDELREVTNPHHESSTTPIPFDFGF